MLQSDLSKKAIPGPRILFAEDDVDIGWIVTEALRAEGFDVTFAENGDLAATILETGSFHLLLTDVRMPGTKDGIDLAMHARRKLPDVPVVIVSGYAEELSLRLANLKGRIKFLRKPFLMTDLMNVIRNSLGPSFSALVVDFLMVSIS